MFPKPSIQFPLLLLVLCFFSSCYYNNEEDLYPTDDCKTEDISYQAEILPLLEDYCLDCHSAASSEGGIVLEGYDNVKLYADSGFLIGVVKQEDGFSLMPQGEDMLEQCLIDKLNSWIEDGAMDN